MRPLLAITTVLLCIVPAAAHAECIDYRDYLHLTGVADSLPGVPSDVAVSGNYAYVASGWFGLLVIDISNPAVPRVTGSVPISGTARRIAVSGNTAYVAAEDGGLVFIDISNPATPEVAATVPDFPAFDVTVANGLAYVAAGASGLQVFYFSNSASPHLLGSVPGLEQAVGVSIAGTHGYVANGDFGVQVVDVSNPANPDWVGGIEVPGFASGIEASGNSAIVANEFAGLFLDLTDPVNPQIVGSVSSIDVSLHASTIFGSHAFLATQSGLEVVDITNPFDRQSVGFIPAPSGAENLTVVGNYAYVVSANSFKEDAGELQVIAIANPVRPPLRANLVTPGDAGPLAISGNYAYVSDARDKFRVIDMTNPAGPTEVASLFMPGIGSSIAVSGSLACLANGTTGGLQVVDISEPVHPRRLGSTDTPGRATRVAISGNHAYVADADSGLQVIDIANPAYPRWNVGSFHGSAWDVAVSDAYAYVTYYGGFDVIDVANPANPHLVSTLELPSNPAAMTVAGTYAFVSCYPNSFIVIDIQQPANPHIVASIRGVFAGSRIAISGHYAYLAALGLQVVDITNPARPRLAGNMCLPTGARDVAIGGDNVYFTDGDLQVVPAQCDPQSPVHLQSLAAERNGNRAVIRWAVSAWETDARFRLWRECAGAARTYLGEAVRAGRDAYAFSDEAPPPGDADYWVQEVDASGEENWYGPAHLAAIIVPGMVRLDQNQPNPFNPRTTIRYSVPQPGRVRLTVYDLRGTKVATLVDADLLPGDSIAEWNGHNSRDNALPSGAYIAKLDTPAGSRTMKMILAK